MPSILRLSIILVLLLATVTLGLMTYNMNKPIQVVQVSENTPAAMPSTIGYFVAARALPRGTLARDEDFTVRSAPPDNVPAGAIFDAPDARIGLRGSLVSKFLAAGSAVTLQDVLRPRDRGFLASVLAPNSRAVSIKVDATTGVSGLIWPGDYVDVVSTQLTDKTGRVIDKSDRAYGTLIQTVLQNVRIVAVDQDMGVPDNAAAGKLATTVSLQLAPEQVKAILVAEQLGKLSLSVRSAVDQQDAGDTDTTVVIHAGDTVKKFSVKKHGAGVMLSADASPELARHNTTAVVNADATARGYPVKLPGRQ